MIKFRLYFDKDKETAWLNKMADKGYAMKGFFAGFYSFEKCEPGKYVYQVDFGDRFFSVGNDYREFMEDTGVEIVQTWGFWIFLRKLATEGDFKLYTDVDSQIEHYTKIRNMFKVITIIEIICLFLEVTSAVNGFETGWAFTFLIGALVVALMNVTFKTNRIIVELKERKGEIVENRFRNGQISMLLPCGLLLNSCALIIQYSVSPMLKGFVQGFALVLMLVGLFQTGNSCRNKTKDTM